LKRCLKTLSASLLLPFWLMHPGEATSSVCNPPAGDESLEMGVSYLYLRKSFMDFPIVWKSTMPMVSASFRISSANYTHRISLHYARSTSIEVNGSRRWGDNSFSILGLNYHLTWYGLPHTEAQRFRWGLGVCLENMQIRQIVEISPGKYNRHEDHYFGVGPALELSWRLGQGQLGFGISSALSIPRASFGVVRSDAGFTQKSYLLWGDLKTNVYYRSTISARCDLVVKLNRVALVYGRTWRSTPKKDCFYSGGSFVFRSLEISLNCSF
jgi:hypothetical protein